MEVNKINQVTLNTITSIPLIDLDDYLAKFATKPHRKFRINCIYFLHDWDDKSVVYVGQSCNLMSRLACHSADRNKEYRKVSIIIVDENDKDLFGAKNIIESFFIHALKPKYNYVMANGAISAPHCIESVTHILNN